MLTFVFNHGWCIHRSSLFFSLYFSFLTKNKGAFFFFLRPLLRHMEVHRLGVMSELQLLAYATTTATPDLTHVCNLHHSLWQCGILNPLSEARDWTCTLMDTSQVLNLLSHSGNSKRYILCPIQPIKTPT